VPLAYFAYFDSSRPDKPAFDAHRIKQALKLSIATAFAAHALGAQANTDAQEDIVRGKALYAQRCAACHSVDYNGVGPSHAGVFGRKAGAVANYAYSPALKASKLNWTADKLDQWLADPEKFVPGQKMGVGVADAGERLALIKYLKTLTGPK
jgi:cytochrome c